MDAGVAPARGARVSAVRVVPGVRQVVAVLVVALGLLLALPVVRPSSAAAGPVADELADRLLAVRPTVGPTWVLDAGATTGQRMLARTLQGLVNRSEARLYLRDGGDGGTGQHWLDHYQAEGLVTVAGTTDLDGALTRFAGEVGGYVLVSEAEPWTVQVGVTMASVEGAVVATTAEEALLAAHGLPLVADLRGRWPDAATAFAQTAATYRAQLASDTVAVLRGSDAALDFAVQQGLLTVFARPPDPAWPTVRTLLAATPPGLPVYGYLSDTGDEEVEALAVLSAEDLVLVPTDTTRNLSFHVAVGAGAARVRAPAADVDDVAPCEADTVNVVVGVTDGDNLNVPLNHFARAANWGSPRRGTLPLAWSMSPALAVLAPAAWDAYAREATPNDELVAMAGWGYAAPALLPDAQGFYTDTVGLMDELGLQVLWSLGGGLETSTSPGWADLEGPAGDGVPDLVLVGYGNGSGGLVWSPDGRPALTSRAVYSETPAQMEAHVRALMATPAGDRPLVSFLSATNWSNPVDALIERLAPLQAEGVRFLTPSQAAACLPDAPPVVPPEPRPGDCTPAGELTEAGLGLIAAPIRAEIQARPATLPVPVAAQAPASVPAGSAIDYRATVTVDVPGFAADVLDERVRPIVLAGYGPELAAAAWVELVFGSLATTVVLPDGATPIGEPVVRPGAAPATAAWTAAGLEVRVGSIVEDTRTPGAPFTVEVEWSVQTDPLDATHLARLLPGGVAFDLDLTVGVQVGPTVLTGTVGAPWTCTPAPGALAETTVLAAPPPPPPPPTDTTSSSATSTSTTAATASNATAPLPAAPPPEPTAVSTDPTDTGAGRVSTSPAAIAVPAPGRYAG